MMIKQGIGVSSMVRSESLKSPAINRELGTRTDTDESYLLLVWLLSAA
jgi:hypothetical protein